MDNIDGEQFRTLEYAVSIPFNLKEWHPLSPAVLLLFIKKDQISGIDAVGDKLPIVVQGDPVALGGGATPAAAAGGKAIINVQGT